jgi:hypothetical protein
MDPAQRLIPAYFSPAEQVDNLTKALDVVSNVAAAASRRASQDWARRAASRRRHCRLLLRDDLDHPRALQ